MEQAPVEQAPQQTQVQTSGETYTVQSGDSLSKIANALGLDWKDIWNANTDTVQDPNLIFVGDQLKLPVAG